MITILIFILSITLNAQQRNSTSEKEIDDIMKWHVLRQQVERAVYRGQLDRIEADKEYSNFRAKMNGRRIKYKDPILEKHFKKYGIENVSNLKNTLLDEDISVNKLEAVLGGMLETPAFRIHLRPARRASLLFHRKDWVATSSVEPKGQWMGVPPC